MSISDTRDSICCIRRAARTARSCVRARPRRRTSTVDDCSVNRRSLDQIVKASPRRRLGTNDRRAPLAIRVRVQTEHRFDFGDGAIGAVTVGLVDDKDVCDFHDAGLQRLHLVSHSWHEHHHRHICSARNLDFVLPDSDRFDRDEIFAGRVEHQGRIRGRARQPAEMTPRRHAANEHAGILRMCLHAHAVAEHGAAAERACGIDGKNANRVSGFAPAHDDAIDQRALARSGRSGHADEERASRSLVQFPHQRGALLLSFSTSEMPRAIARGSPERIDAARADNPRNLSRTCTLG